MRRGSLTRLAGFITARFVVSITDWISFIITGWAGKVEIPQFSVLEIAAVFLFTGCRSPVAPVFAFIALHRVVAASEFYAADTAIEYPVLLSPIL